MAHKLVKIITNEDGEKVDNPTWHVVNDFGDSPRTLCGGEAFGQGESSATYKEKTTEKGVPCRKCRDIIKSIKSIRL